jgi:hypothetical protein
VLSVTILYHNFYSEVITHRCDAVYKADFVGVMGLRDMLTVTPASKVFFDWSDYGARAS